MSTHPIRTTAEIALALALNRRLERLMPLLTPGGVLLGFLLPGAFGLLRPLVPGLFAVMTLTGALKLQARELALALRNPLPPLLFFLFSHILLPWWVFFISSHFFDNADITSGFVLLFASPTAVSGFIWVSIYGGDQALALALILLDTLAAPLVMPGTLAVLGGREISLNMGGMTLSLIFMVVLPTIVGVAINEASRGTIPRRVSPYLGPVSKLCLVLVISANAAATAGQIHLGESRVWIIAALCVVFAMIGFTGIRLAGFLCRIKPEQGVSLFFAVGLRNISAAATIALEFFPQEAALPAILGIVFQQVTAALMGKGFIRKRRQE